MSDRRRWAIALSAMLIAWPIIGTLNPVEPMSWPAAGNAAFIMLTYQFVWELLA